MIERGPVRGTIQVPGDKSISHRALIVAAHGAKQTTIENLNPGRDVAATIGALRAMGVTIRTNAESCSVGGGVLEPRVTIDAQNSASTVRMLAGVCAGAGIAASFDGDASLRKRPMEPLAQALQGIGAAVVTTAGCLPLAVSPGGWKLRGLLELREPSAQVKAALLFAALFRGQAIEFKGAPEVRDHTERMLEYLGADIQYGVERIAFKPRKLQTKPLVIAGDLSAAIVFLVAASITRGSELEVRGVGVNPTRAGALESLRAMGAAIEVTNERVRCGEPLADIRAHSAVLYAVDIPAETTARAIDDIPAIAVAAAFAQGTTTISGIGRLREKESDRAAGIQDLLRALGIRSDVSGERLIIHGGAPALPHGPVSANGDHRLAMAAAAAAASCGPFEVSGIEWQAVSFPAFAAELQRSQIP